MDKPADGDLIFKLKVSFTGKLGRKLLSIVRRPFVRFLRFGPHRAHGFRLAPLGGAEQDARGKDLAVVSVDHKVSAESIARIPREGPVIAVANHPFGGVEPVVLASVLRGVREDVRVVADHFIERTPQMRDSFATVDPLDETKAARASRERCIEWVRGGGMLVLFPAREVSRLDLKRREVADPKWRRSVARLIREARAPVLPIFFGGANSALFQILGLVHYRLSSIVLPNELFSRQRKQIQVHVGGVIPFEKLDAFRTSDEMAAYLRMRTYILDSSDRAGGMGRRARRLARRRRGAAAAPVAPPSDPAAVVREVEALPADCILARMGEFSVFLAAAEQIPQLLREVGRLREITFREVNEGTGKALDLDRFDDYYRHLVVWNTEQREIVGAYRIGLTDEILDRYGAAGLYTTTLFKFKPGMLRKISPAIELGRSFVRSEYQKSYAPLMLLWKGIGELLLRDPRYKVLFGPVSINEQYKSMSRHLMIRFLKENNYMRDLARFVKAKTPVKARAKQS